MKLIKNKNVLFYIALGVSLFVITGIFILTYFLTIDRNYLYFEKAIIDVNFGDRYNICDLGIKTNFDLDEITFSAENATIKDNYITFDKAGLCKIYAKRDGYSAKLQAKVAFGDVNEYMSVFADDGISKIQLMLGSEIDLFLPSESRDVALLEGFASSVNISVYFKKATSDFVLVAEGGLIAHGDNIFTNKLGKYKASIDFEEYGRVFDFYINVLPIDITDIVCDYDFNSIYVDKDSKFDIAVEVLPSYATDKNLSIDFGNSFIYRSGDKFIVNEYGESFVTFYKGDVTLKVNVVVCEKPDEMAVVVLNEFKNGETCSASVSFYKNETLIDGEFYIECYKNGVMLDSETFLTGYSIKHNVFSCNIISAEEFVILVKCRQNNNITFEITVNNKANVV